MTVFNNHQHKPETKVIAGATDLECVPTPGDIEHVHVTMTELPTYLEADAMTDDGIEDNLQVEPQLSIRHPYNKTIKTNKVL